MSSIFVPSTLRLTVQEKPDFYYNRKIGRYDRLPLTLNRKIEGGLRLKNSYKCSLKDRPLVTYITIVRNNKKGILRCMESVWQQNYDNIEYIVIDGDSTDGTTEVIMEHIDKIDYFVSEPDLGIYNAFNKGLSLASGQVINILNSDDCLYEDAAENAVLSMIDNNSDILFGAAMCYSQEGKELYKHNPFEMHEGTIFIGTPACHNAVYATNKAYEAIGYYREDIKIAADFKWMLDAWYQNFVISYSSNLYVKYSLGGVSDDINKFFTDVEKIILEYYPDLSSSDAKVLLNTFCMYLPPAVIQQNEKEQINSIINRNRSNEKLILSILRAMITKTYQYDTLINTVERTEPNYFQNIKDKVFWSTKGTVLHKPLRKMYRLFKK